MRPRHWISIGVGAVVLGAAAWSFQANVLDPHDGEVVSASGTSYVAPSTPSTAEASAGGEADTSSSTAPDSASALPQTLGDLDLAASISGVAAMEAVGRLHGKDVGGEIVDAWVGEYGVESGAAAQATVWVSRSPDPAGARELYERMTERISLGTSPFTGLRPIEGDGLDLEIEGYALDGMGQVHYYFLAGSDLYWLAAAPESAADLLAGLASTALGSVEGR